MYIVMYSTIQCCIVVRTWPSCRWVFSGVPGEGWAGPEVRPQEIAITVRYGVCRVVPMVAVVGVSG